MHHKLPSAINDEETKRRIQELVDLGAAQKPFDFYGQTVYVESYILEVWAPRHMKAIFHISNGSVIVLHRINK